MIDPELTKSFSGVILVTRGGEQLFSAAHGLANRAEAIPNRLDTRFAQASGTKTLTAIAVARLIEEGAFGFDTPMMDCLDLWPGGFDSGVTVHHLLSHTSGIPDYFDEEVDEDFEALWADVASYSIKGPGDVLPMFVDRPMKFEPGGRFSYCNSGYLMLGLLIEQHSGKSWSEYTQDQVIAPSGMADSGFYRLDRLPSRAALNYLTDEDPDDPRTNIFTVPNVPQPDGGAFVTAPDMARLWDTLASGTVLKSATLETMKHRHTPRYGYGLWIEEQGDRLVHHAEGGDPGVNFVSGVSFDTDTVVTVISNTDGGVAKIYRTIWEGLTD